MTALATPRPDPTLAGYDEDFALWAEQQAALLRAIGDPRLDIENIAEELEGLSRSDRREIESRLIVILIHLLKWQYQPDRRSGSWQSSVIESRRQIAMLLRESPSLKRYPASVLDEVYPTARLSALAETRLPDAVIPETCPYTIAQVLDPDFLSDA